MMKLWESNFSQVCDCSYGAGYAWDRSQVPFGGVVGMSREDGMGMSRGWVLTPQDMGPDGDGYSLPSGIGI